MTKVLSYLKMYKESQYTMWIVFENFAKFKSHVRGLHTWNNLCRKIWSMRNFNFNEKFYFNSEKWHSSLERSSVSIFQQQLWACITTLDPENTSTIIIFTFQKSSIQSIFLSRTTKYKPNSNDIFHHVSAGLKSFSISSNNKMSANKINVTKCNIYFNVNGDNGHKRNKPATTRIA